MHKPIFILFMLLPMLFSSACSGDELDLNIKPFGPSLTGKLNTISWAFQGAAVQDISPLFEGYFLRKCVLRLVAAETKL